MSREQLAYQISISKHRVDTLLKSTSIDTSLLTRISIALGINFFDYYRKDEDLAQFEIDILVQSDEELNKLKNLIKEKINCSIFTGKPLKAKRRLLMHSKTFENIDNFYNIFR